jgi:hypothetical protein
MKQYTVKITQHPATPYHPAEYSAPVEPHAAPCPSQASHLALAGWRRNEEAHQARHRRLVRAEQPAMPATFSFVGWFRTDAEEQAICRAIVEKFGTDVSRYPSEATVEA